MTSDNTHSNKCLCTNLRPSSYKLNQQRQEITCTATPECMDLDSTRVGGANSLNFIAHYSTNLSLYTQLNLHVMLC